MVMVIKPSKIIMPILGAIGAVVLIISCIIIASIYFLTREKSRVEPVNNCEIENNCSDEPSDQ